MPKRSRRSFELVACKVSVWFLKIIAFLRVNKTPRKSSTVGFFEIKDRWLLCDGEQIIIEVKVHFARDLVEILRKSVRTLMDSLTKFSINIKVETPQFLTTVPNNVCASLAQCIVLK